MDYLKDWLCDLLEEIGSGKDSETYLKLLKNCGANCAKRNALPGLISLREELAGIQDMEEIAGIIGRRTGAECVPAPDGFTLTYNRGKGCDCALVKEGYVEAPVFCNCTLGFHEKVWSTIFDRPVEVKLLETFLRGGDCCAQKITLIEHEKPAGYIPD